MGERHILPDLSSSPTQQQGSWEIAALETVKEGDKVELKHVQLTWKSDLFASTFSRLLCERWGKSTLLHVHWRERVLWCFVELLPMRGGTGSESAVTLGFSLHFDLRGTDLSVCLGHLHAIGTPPRDFVPALWQTLAATFLTEKNGIRHLSVFEMVVPLLRVIGGEKNISLPARGSPKFKTSWLADGMEFLYPAAAPLASFAEIPALPLEVLESRADGQAVQHLDEKILAADFATAWQILKKGDDRGTKLSPAELRRLALLLHSTPKADQAEALLGATEAFPNDILFASALLQVSTQNTKVSPLHTLSHLVAQLQKELPDLEDLAAYEISLNETLGDLWLEEDLTTALAAYERVVTRRGLTPRLLQKLATVARLQRDKTQELHYLMQLAQLERRQKDLAQVYMRMGELHAQDSSDTQEELGAYLAASQADPAHLEAVLAAARVLRRRGSSNQALQFLERYREEFGANLPKAKAIQLSLELADLWRDELGRSDLAENIYQEALQLGLDDWERILEMESAARSRGSSALVVATLNRKIALLLKRGDISALIPMVKELLKLSSGQEIDWVKIYDSLVHSRLAPQDSYALHILLASIAQDRLNDKQASLKHLYLAWQHGKLKPHQASLLAADMAVSREFETLAQLIGGHLDVLPPSLTSDYLTTIMRLPLLERPTSFTVIFVDALVAYPQELEIASEDYLAVLIEQEEETELQKFLKLAVEKSALLGMPLVRKAIELAKGVSSRKKANLVLQSYHLLMSVSEENRQILLQAFADLYELDKQSPATLELARDIVRRGLTGSSDMARLEEVLQAHPADLVVLTEQRLSEEQNLSLKAKYCLQAAHLYQKQLMDPGAALKFFLRACEMSPLSSGDVEVVVQLARARGDLATCAQVYERQAELTAEKELQEKYLENATRIYVEEMQQLEQATTLLEKLVSVQGGEESPWRQQLAQLRVATQKPTPADLKIMLQDSFKNAGASETYQAIWQKALQGGLLSSADGDFLAFVKNTMQQAQKAKEFWELLVESLHDPSWYSVPKSVIVPLLVEGGKYFQDHKHHPARVLTLWQRVFTLDPAVKDVWIPLYFVHREISTPEDKKEYLLQMLPHLKKAPEVLQEYPVTLASLEAEAGLAPAPVTSFAETASDEPPPAEKTQVIDVSVVHNPASENLDWRALFQDPSKITREVMERLSSMAFVSVLEKHLALQALALKSGLLSTLSGWQWRVWREPTEFGYALNGRERMPSGHTLPYLDTVLTRFTTAASPIFVQLLPGRFQLAGLASRLKLSLPELEAAIQPISWQDPLLSRSGLSNFENRITKHRYQIASLSGLGSHIFFDSSKRRLLIDKDYYQRQPPTHLTHRILRTIWSLKLQYFVVMNMDDAELYGASTKLFTCLNTQGLAGLMMKLGLSREPVMRYLWPAKREQLTNLAQRMNPFQRQDINDVQRDMELYILQLLLVETLDLVGIVEMLAETDFTAKEELSKDVCAKHPQVKKLLDFILTLRLS